VGPRQLRRRLSVGTVRTRTCEARGTQARGQCSDRRWIRAAQFYAPRAHAKGRPTRSRRISWTFRELWTARRERERMGAGVLSSCRSFISARLSTRRAAPVSSSVSSGAHGGSGGAIRRPNSPVASRPQLVHPCASSSRSAARISGTPTCFRGRVRTAPDGLVQEGLEVYAKAETLAKKDGVDFFRALSKLTGVDEYAADSLRALDSLREVCAPAIGRLP
jgi:hypothetical protein